MRILALTNLYPNPLQPERATHVRLQLRHIARQHPVAVISPIAWTDELVRRWRGGVMPPKRRTVVDGIEVEHPRYWYLPLVLRHWTGHFFEWSVRGAFRRALREFQPDLVYSPWAYPDGWAAVRLGRRAGVPVVLTVVGSDILLLPQYPQKAARTIEALRGAEAIIAVSQDLARRVVQLGAAPGKVHVVYDGVEPEVFCPGPRAAAHRRLGLCGTAPMILFVGNLLPVKGLDYLIEACSLLKADGVDFECVLIGEGPLRKRLEADVRKRGLAEFVRFLGVVPNQELPDWYRAANVFVLPSRSEGVPNVLLEAAACHTPFVASRVGGIPEIAHVGESELVPVGDIQRLARAVRRYVTEPGAPGPRARPRTRTEGARQVCEVFERVCGESSVHPAREIEGTPSCEWNEFVSVG
jgi:glycosyltransferase involved in cell wall biosynthesis